MRVSVCTLTARRGFLDLQAKMLSAQNYPKDQLEWVVVDFAYEERVSALQVLGKELGLTIRHIPNFRDNTLYFRDITRNRNRALRYATGDAAVFLDDYAAIPPTFVAEHANLLGQGCLSAGRMFRLEQTYDDGDANADSPRQEMLCGRVPGMLEKFSASIGKDYRDKGDDKVYKAMGITYTGNLGIPRFIWEHLNGFDPRMESGLEDCDFGLRACLSKFYTFYNPAAYTINLAVGCAPYTYHFDHTHDVEPFISNPNNNFWGDSKLKENDTIKVHFHTGYRIAECKICGATAMIDPNEIMEYKMKNNECRVPPGLLGGYDTQKPAENVENK